MAQALECLSHTHRSGLTLYHNINQRGEGSTDGSKKVGVQCQPQLCRNFEARWNTREPLGKAYNGETTDHGYWVDSNPLRVGSESKTRFLLEFPKTIEETGLPKQLCNPWQVFGAQRRLGYNEHSGTQVANNHKPTTEGAQDREHGLEASKGM